MSVIIGPLGTAISIPDALGVVGVKVWALGMALTVALGYSIKWAKNSLPGVLAGWVIVRVQTGLAGAGVENGDLKELIHDITIPLVKFAEKKLPDSGLGPQRLAWIEDALSRIPWAGFLFHWIITTKQAEWRAVVEACVARMDEELKKVPKV